MFWRKCVKIVWEKIGGGANFDGLCVSCLRDKLLSFLGWGRLTSWIFLLLLWLGEYCYYHMVIKLCVFGAKNIFRINFLFKTLVWYSWSPNIWPFWRFNICTLAKTEGFSASRTQFNLYLLINIIDWIVNIVCIFIYLFLLTYAVKHREEHQSLP